MNYCLCISYDGTNFHGWAKQPNLRTVEQTIINTIKSLFNIDDININASGRTDAKVHAINQIINIKSKQLNLNTNQLLHALNAKLPNDIRVNDIKIVDDKFHARYHCINKSYLYLINTRPQFDLFNQNHIYQLNEELNINKLNEASKLFLGTHNFLSFSTSSLNDTIRTINFIEIKQENGLFFIKINANGFLRSMVRMIVASLIAYSQNKISLDDIKQKLETPIKGSSQLKAPGCGLYLYEVNYK